MFTAYFLNYVTVVASAGIGLEDWVFLHFTDPSILVKTLSTPIIPRGSGPFYWYGYAAATAIDGIGAFGNRFWWVNSSTIKVGYQIFSVFFRSAAYAFDRIRISQRDVREHQRQMEFEDDAYMFEQKVYEEDKRGVFTNVWLGVEPEDWANFAWDIVKLGTIQIVIWLPKIYSWWKSVS